MGVNLALKTVTWLRRLPQYTRGLRAQGVGWNFSLTGTLLGKSEHTGNAPMDGVPLHLSGLGVRASTNDEVLNEPADLDKALGQGAAPKYPLYARDALRSRASIHANNLNRSRPRSAPMCPRCWDGHWP